MWDKLLRKIPNYDPFYNSEPYYFDEKTADNVVKFFELGLCHVKTKIAGQPFLLEDWQKAIVGNIVGWKKKSDGLRRYQEALILVPRKNGKTLLAAGLANYFLFCDGEPGAEIYCAAAEREQAAILFDIAKTQIEMNPALRNKCNIQKKVIELPKLRSFFKAISAEANTKHGYNPHVAIIDELHAQKNRELYDTLQTGMGARDQPLLLSISTQDYDRESICNDRYNYAKKVAEKTIDNTRFLPVIYEADRKDDWTSEEIWKKANPNYGISIRKEFLRDEVEKAKANPAYENTVKRLYFDMKTEQAERWIPMYEWNKCNRPIVMDDLIGKECIGGLDLSSVSDITALVLLFKNVLKKDDPDQDDFYTFLPFFWMPAENVAERDKKEAPYLMWNKQGFMDFTPGNVVDYSFIRKKVNDLSKIYKIKEIAFDNWNATQIATQLEGEDGFQMIEFRQGFKSMNEPCKNLEILWKKKGFTHGGNPVLRWMASNVAAVRDPADNIKLDKKKSSEKIDGIVSMVMCIGRAITQIDKKSIYEEQDGLFSMELSNE